MWGKESDSNETGSVCNTTPRGQVGRRHLCHDPSHTLRAKHGVESAAVTETRVKERTPSAEQTESRMRKKGAVTKPHSGLFGDFSTTKQATNNVRARAPASFPLLVSPSKQVLRVKPKRNKHEAPQLEQV